MYSIRYVLGMYNDFQFVTLKTGSMYSNENNRNGIIHIQSVCLEMVSKEIQDNLLLIYTVEYIFTINIETRN